MIEFLKLIRLPNIFTAISNILAGAIIANNGILPIPDTIYASIASASIYSGGMAFNDYCDRNYDKIYRPERPIPRGKISERNALYTVFILMIVGIISGFLISNIAGFIALLIVIFAMLYDIILKNYFLSGITSMGICRGLNWSLGLVAGGSKLIDIKIGIPIAIFIYIAGITAFSRHESENYILRKIVTIGIIFIPLIDGLILYHFGYWLQGIIVSLLVIPVLLMKKIFDIT